MEVTAHGSVEPQDPHEWSAETVVVFVRSLGPSECFQSPGDQVLYLGVDDSVFFALSLNDLEGVCGHARVYDRMCEFTQQHRCACEHNGTDRPQLYTFMTHTVLCNVPVLLFLQVILHQGWDCQGYLEGVLIGRGN